MGTGILVIVVGVLAGAVMVAWPRRLWWVTESWKFKNPEANEPSDTVYGLTRAGGVGLVIVALFLGGSIISDDLSAKRKREAEQAQAAVEAAFVAPAPENRGPLPVIGYFTQKFPKSLRVTVYYLAPGESVRAEIRESASRGPNKWNFPCYTYGGAGPVKAGPLLVNPELFWAPKELGDLAKSDGCRLGVGHKVHETSRFVDGSVAPPIVTDSAIVDRNGTEILPAAAGNVVPKLTQRMYPDP
ncbi:DUF6199 family natural product biosynthesis protein [Mycolicibacterium houstonense]|uniref:DUF6199 family natural product biosynthesis protein n=1 Tax=Mycolicibacterium houstonense TaxID=146021 RepID=UPI0008313CA8|nr:DUF6199 family natural product biosynthesis protein [Mycolicibacterium houstonense]